MKSKKQPRRIYLKNQISSKFLRVFAVIVTVVVLLCLMPRLSAEAAAGMLDTTFGNGGKVITDIANTEDGALAMAIQPDGKIVTAGGSGVVENNLDFALIRYNSDGSLDDSFGAGGKVVTAFSSANDSASAVAVQTDGKIVAAGRSGNFPADFALARYNANGTLDNTFGTGGKVITPVNAGNDEIYAMAIQTDGKIIVAGETRLVMQSTDFALVRYNANGSLDNTFGTGGIVITTVGSSFEEAYAIAIQTDGKIIAAGGSDVAFGRDFALVRYNSNGSLDKSFGAGGKVTTSIGGGGDIKAIAIHADGRIAAAGYAGVGASLDIALASYNTDGTLDTTFGTDGKVLTPIGSGDEIANSVIVQSNGKIVAAGWSDNGVNADFALVRYHTNGSLDNTFGTGGKVITPIGNSTDFVYAAGLQTDGKIVAVGVSHNGANFDFALARYIADAVSTQRAPFDFDGDVKTDLSIFRPSVGEWWYLKSSDGGNAAAQFGNSTDKITPGDFTGDGKTDIALWRPSSGEWFILRSEDASYYSFPFGANGDIPAPADFDGDGKADAAIFRPSNATWYISRSSGGTTIQQFGANGDVPVAADCDADGKADIAIWRAAVGEWWIQRSTAGLLAFQFGASTDKPVQGDFTADGKTDAAFWRPSTGFWFVLRSEDFSFYSFPFGATDDMPAPGDYDGDGKFDAAVFRPSSSTWYIQRSTAGTLIQGFGQNGDIPVPSAFIP